MDKEEKHESLAVYLKACGKTLCTGLTVDRGWLPWFRPFMSWPIGITCEAVVVLPIAVMRGRRYIPCGIRKNRAMRKFDVGAVGMCDASKSVLRNACGELWEELGLVLPWGAIYQRFKPNGPTGHTVIVHFYTFQLTTIDLPELTSNDKTFERIDWVELDADMIHLWMTANDPEPENRGIPYLMPNNWKCVEQAL